MNEMVIFWVAVALLVAFICWFVSWLEGTLFVRKAPPPFRMYINIL